MTQNQINYQRNLIEQSHNLATEDIEMKKAKAAQLNAEVAKNRLIYVDAPNERKKADASILSAFGSILRGTGSIFSILS